MDSAIPTGLEAFHPIVQHWFITRFKVPTEAQMRGWPNIVAGRNTLIAAPTGSGKTLAAFLACLDQLIRKAISGQLDDTLKAVYISPLRALTNDVRKNLQVPLDELRMTAFEMGFDLSPIKIMTRSSDSTSSERQRFVKHPPHLLVTTPESLYLLLSSPKSRHHLKTVETVIVDEIHSLARDKRGTHLSLSLQRLDRITQQRPVRIGLSATQRPMETIAEFLVGCDDEMPDRFRPCSIIDGGHQRDLDLRVEAPASELGAVCTHEQWAEVVIRLQQLVEAHKSTLVFTNTRRLCERIGHELSELLGKDRVATHHGSLSKDTRLDAEQRLKSGELKAIVATASLELGIDVGYVDLVCQIGSPRSIATFLQRIGRSGHSIGATPKGRMFALTRDELIECLTLVRAVRQGKLDTIEIPEQSTDVLCQQIIAECALDEQDFDSLYELVRTAWPFRNLSREQFDAVIEMLGDRNRRSPDRGAYLHVDRVNRKLRASRGSRIVAVTCGGAIPDTADYRVVNVDENNSFVGTVNEDFAIESQRGDIFLLGNTSWQIERVVGNDVHVRDAEGAPASIPFWFGEAPGRTFELSEEVSSLRRDVTLVMESQTDVESQIDAASKWLRDECLADDWTADQASRYLVAQFTAIGILPQQKQVVFERFFDESGGMQLVIHAPFGTRINRAWGLAMRKRFCRSFDFELQASASDNGLVLSLGPQHSFALEDLFRMLTPENGEHMLTQALLAVPMFQIRWRWNAARSLMLRRNKNGKRVPPAIQRFHSEDFLTAVFPLQTACFEHRPPDMEIPDHPLVRQSVYDCLHEAMDLKRWLGVLKQIQDGDVVLHSRDTREPSPFAHELLNARPFEFLDNAPLEERRARAVQTRRTLNPADFTSLTALDPQAIEQIRAEAFPLIRSADELQDLLLWIQCWPEDRAEPHWHHLFELLAADGRAVRLTVSPAAQANDSTPKILWIATETWPVCRSAYPNARAESAIELPALLDVTIDETEAVKRIVRGHMEVAGPTTLPDVAEELGLSPEQVEVALITLEVEGAVLRGSFTGRCAPVSSANLPSPNKPSLSEQDRHGHAEEGDHCPLERSPVTADIEWCDRRLLARIHRLTLDGVRKSIKPVERADLLRVLFELHHVDPPTRASDRQGLKEVIEQLQGFEAPVGAWEESILSARVNQLDQHLLDLLCLGGEVAWGRLSPPSQTDPSRKTHALNRASLMSLFRRHDVRWLTPIERDASSGSSDKGGSGSPSQSGKLASNSTDETVFLQLKQQGASFFNDLWMTTKLLPAQLETSLRNLAAQGLVNSDSYLPVRAWARQKAISGMSGETVPCGRWSMLGVSNCSEEERIEKWAWLLLARYGLVCWDLAQLEPLAPPWSKLRRFYQRLEARGEIRGGRFVSKLSGEQFAKPEFVDKLRRSREEVKDLDTNLERLAVISASDPLNLFGLFELGPKIPRNRNNTIVSQQGKLLAAKIGKEVIFFTEIVGETRQAIIRMLQRTARSRLSVRDHQREGDESANALNKPVSDHRVSAALSQNHEAKPKVIADPPKANPRNSNPPVPTKRRRQTKPPQRVFLSEMVDANRSKAKKGRSLFDDLT